MKALILTMIACKNCRMRIRNVGISGVAPNWNPRPILHSLFSGQELDRTSSDSAEEKDLKY